MSIPTTEKMTQFIKKYGLILELQELLFRYDNLRQEWDKGARHYQFRISAGRGNPPIRVLYDKSPIRGVYSQGSALTARPKLQEILESISLSVRDFIDGTISFSEWCSNYGYDTDSLQALRIFKACQQEYEQALALLGREALQELIDIQE